MYYKYSMNILIGLLVIGAVIPERVGAENRLPLEYQANNPDASTELYQRWIQYAKQFENAKATLISKGKIYITKNIPPSLGDEDDLERAGVSRALMASTLKAQKECGMRIVVPANAGYGGASCLDPSGLDTTFGLVGALETDKSVMYGHQVEDINPKKGYKYGDYYVRPTFYIYDNQNFEQSLLKSAQLGADGKSLFMNWQLTPKMHLGPAKFTQVEEKFSDGTQMIVGKVVWSYRHRGRVKYSACIYSLHGHIHRSAEAVTCFDDVKGKNFSNKYVDEYMQVIESIRLAP